MPPTPFKRALVAFVIALALTSCLSFAGVYTPLGSLILGRLRPEIHSVTADAIGFVLSMVFMLTAFFWILRLWDRLVRRRAKRLLRRLVTPEQYQGYCDTGWIIERMPVPSQYSASAGEEWIAEITTAGTRWVPPEDASQRDTLTPSAPAGSGSVGYWECIFANPRDCLCKEDQIIAQLLHARQQSYLKKLWLFRVSERSFTIM